MCSTVIIQRVKITVCKNVGVTRSLLFYVGGLPWELYLHGNIRISQQVFISTSSLVFIFENIIVESLRSTIISVKEALSLKYYKKKLN